MGGHELPGLLNNSRSTFPRRALAGERDDQQNF
jgi:hypothetical protein